MDVYELARRMDEIAGELGEHGYECLAEEISTATDQEESKTAYDAVLRATDDQIEGAL